MTKLYHLFIVISIILLMSSGTTEGQTANSSLPFQHLGCFVDKSERTMPIFMGTVKSPWECYLKVKTKGLRWPVFGTQYGKECWSSSYGDKTYNKYGTTDICKMRMGEEWANDVYQRTDLANAICNDFDNLEECSWVENRAFMPSLSNILLLTCTIVPVG